MGARYDGDLGEVKASRSRATFIVLINLVSLGFLVWTLRDAQLADLKSDFDASDWWWVGLAIVAELSVYLLQGVRWSLVLRPVISLRFWHSVRAIFAGLFASEVIPLRAGEVLRCYLVSRWTGLPFSVSAASVLIERVFDGIWLCIGLALTFEFVQFPRQLAYVNAGVGVFVLAGTVLLAFALFQPKSEPAPLPERGWRRRLAVLREDLALIGHSWSLFYALLQSVPYLVLQAVPVWALFQGYDFGLGFGHAFALMVILRLASIVPQAPASLGLFQYVTKEVLERTFGIASPEAARFSLVLWGIIKLPALAAGFAAMAITGARLDEANKAADEHVASTNLT